MKKINHLISTINKAKKNKQIIVLVTGVFDVLHQEHVKFLTKAKQEGDLLLIGVETDQRVKSMKGNDRPINSQEERIKNLQNLNITSHIFLLPQNFHSEKDHQKLIKLIKPNILAISSHTKYQSQKQKILSKFGGEVKIIHQHNPKISTTNILKN